jgi:hypothetical protein
MMRKIAIITNSTHCFDQYGDDYSRVVDSITDWTEVSDEDYRALATMQHKLGFNLIEQPTDTGVFIGKTVAAYIAYAKAEEIAQETAKKQREAAALDRKYKKELKDKDSKEKMLAKLIDELGPDAVKKVTQG